MKKRLLVFLFLLVLSLTIVNAAESGCDLNTTLVNQDPYPAQTGEEVELVFQLSGVESSKCQGAVFEIIPKFPFSLVGNESGRKVLPASTFIRDYKKAWMIPYELKVDEDALEGKEKIEIKYESGKLTNVYFSKKFNVKIEDLRVDFEISVEDYDSTTNEITFEILNTGEHDVEALTAEIINPDQMQLYGAPRKVIGPLDSNEETTFTFKALPKEDSIDLKILYTDQINERRTVNKTVKFNPDYFKVQEEGYSTSFYLLITLILIIIIYWTWKKYGKKS